MAALLQLTMMFKVREPKTIRPKTFANEQTGDRVLRIERSENGQVVFALSGRIDRGEIDELETLIASEKGKRRVVLDLTGVTLAGQEAIVFLDRCEVNGVTLRNCAGYVRAWIARRRSGR